MRKLLVVVLATAVAPVAAARVWTTVYRCDGTTPLAAVDPNEPGVYPDIMVATRLAIVISSDTGEPWSGGLMMSHEDWGYGTLSGRGFDDGTRNYIGSCFEGAGEIPLVMDTMDSLGRGLLFSTYFNANPPPGQRVVAPGDWFVFDYQAEQVGRCRVELFDGGFNLLETLSFNHVPSRDFDGDTIVNLRDFAILASYWRSVVDPESEGILDLNADAQIDISEIALLSEHWLERTDCAEAGADPNEPAESPDTTGDPFPW